jgi:hypothetical protein
VGGTKVLDDQQIARRVRVIRRIYACLSCLGGLAVFFVLLGLSAKHSRTEAFEGFLFVWASAFAYYGLKVRTSWVIPLLLIMSTFTLIRGLLAVLEPANDLRAFFHKTVASGFVFFAFYQICIFRRKEVRQYFGTSGKVIV